MYKINILPEILPKSRPYFLLYEMVSFAISSKSRPYFDLQK